MKKSSETEKTHTFFLKIGEGMMQKWSLRSVTRSVWANSVEREMGRQWIVTKSSRENWKRFKNSPYFCQNARFSWLKWVANKSPSQAAKTLKDKIVKKFSKCFSRLKGLPARESRAEPRKSLSNPRDWTFHSRTSHQKWPANMRLRLATWLTCDWAAKTGQNWVFEIFRFLNKILSKNT